MLITKGSSYRCHCFLYYILLSIEHINTIHKQSITIRYMYFTNSQAGHDEDHCRRNCMSIYATCILFSNFLFTVNDFSIVTSDILLRDPEAGIDIAITISVDGIAGEPPETFTITSRPPAVSSPIDSLFLFQNTTVTIIDSDSKKRYQLKNYMHYRYHL